MIEYDWTPLRREATRQALDLTEGMILLGLGCLGTLAWTLRRIGRKITATG